MKYTLNNNERNFILQFQELRYPSIFKTDDTDRILFAEDIKFPICGWLLKGKSIPASVFNDIIENYERFIKDTDVREFDDYSLNYYNLCLQVVEIMKKYYLSGKEQNGKTT